MIRARLIPLLNISFFFIPLLSVSCTSSQSAVETKHDAHVTTLEVKKELWSTSEQIFTPESSYFDENSGFIFVSNMAGDPTSKEGKGSIAKLSSDGTMLDAKWVTGLNSPKGIRVKKDVLFVTAIDEVLTIQIGNTEQRQDGEIINRYKIAEAQFLNDLDIADDGTIFVSDMYANKIFSIKGDTIHTFDSGAHLQSPNGLLVHKDKLYIASVDIHVNGVLDPEKSLKNGNVYSIDLVTKKQEFICKNPIGILDGLEMDNEGNILASNFVTSTIYKISSDGNITPVLTEEGNIADFSFDHQNNRLIIPLMSKNTIKAFRYE